MDSIVEYKLQRIMGARSSMATLLAFKFEKNERLAAGFRRLEVQMNVCFINFEWMTVADQRLVLSIVITAVARHQRTSPEKIYTGEWNYEEFKLSMLKRFDPDAPAELIKSVPPPKTDRQKRLDDMGKEVEWLAEERVKIAKERLESVKNYSREMRDSTATNFNFFKPVDTEIKNHTVQISYEPARLHKYNREKFPNDPCKAIDWLLQRQMGCIVIGQTLIPYGKLDVPFGPNLRAILESQNHQLDIPEAELDKLLSDKKSDPPSSYFMSLFWEIPMMSKNFLSFPDGPESKEYKKLIERLKRTARNPSVLFDSTKLSSSKQCDCKSSYLPPHPSTLLGDKLPVSNLDVEDKKSIPPDEYTYTYTLPDPQPHSGGKMPASHPNRGSAPPYRAKVFTKQLELTQEIVKGSQPPASVARDKFLAGGQNTGNKVAQPVIAKQIEVIHEIIQGSKPSDCASIARDMLLAGDQFTSGDHTTPKASPYRAKKRQLELTHEIIQGSQPLDIASMTRDKLLAGGQMSGEDHTERAKKRKVLLSSSTPRASPYASRWTRASSCPPLQRAG